MGLSLRVRVPLALQVRGHLNTGFPVCCYLTVINEPLSNNLYQLALVRCLPLSVFAVYFPGISTMKLVSVFWYCPVFPCSFSWTRNGTHFDIDEDPNVTMKPHSGTLVVDISRVKAEQYECVYQCTARNKHGTAISNNIVVRQSSTSSVISHVFILIPLS